MKVIFILISLLLLLSIFCQNSLAISFGSYQKVSKIKIPRDGLGKAELLVWNSGEEEFLLEFEAVKSPGIEVLIKPRKVILTKDPAGKTEIVSIGKIQYRALVIEVTFKPLSYASSGDVVIEALARGREGGQVSVSQRRDFKFHVEIEGEGVRETLLPREVAHINLTKNETTSNISKPLPEENLTTSNNTQEWTGKERGSLTGFLVLPRTTKTHILILLSIFLGLIFLLALRKRKRTGREFF